MQFFCGFATLLVCTTAAFGQASGNIVDCSLAGEYSEKVYPESITLPSTIDLDNNISTIAAKFPVDVSEPITRTKITAYIGRLATFNGDLVGVEGSALSMYLQRIYRHCGIIERQVAISNKLHATGSIDQALAERVIEDATARRSNCDMSCMKFVGHPYFGEYYSYVGRYRSQMKWAIRERQRL